MTIDEAIKHCRKVAWQNENAAVMNKQKKEASRFLEKDLAEKAELDCLQCAADHRQLAEWLKDLKEAKRLLKAAVEGFERNNCHTAICETCKHHDGCDYDDNFIWRYIDEVFKIIDKE